MHIRRKGRKIYTYRVKNRRVFSKYHPMRSALSTVLTLVVLAFLGVVGYNVVGPLVTRLSAEKERPTMTPDPYIYEEQQTTAVTTIGSDSQEEISTETTAAPMLTPLQLSLYLNPNALSDIEKLRTVVSEAAAEGYHAVVVPLKLSGGALQYQSLVNEAKECGATSETLPTLSEIATTISECGVFPIARIETISDHLMPAEYQETGYRNTATEKLWRDDETGAEGKPWMTPFADESRQYLQNIASEIANAGFRNVICGGVEYPHFMESDYEILGPMLSDEASRSSGLVGMLNAIGDATSAAVCEVELSRAIAGEEESLNPDALNLTTAMVLIDFDKFNGTFFHASERYDVSKLAYPDKALMLMQIAEEVTGTMSVLPCIRSSNLTQSQLEAVIDTMYEIGYTEIFIQS